MDWQGPIHGPLLSANDALSLVQINDNHSVVINGILERSVCCMYILYVCMCVLYVLYVCMDVLYMYVHIVCMYVCVYCMYCMYVCMYVCVYVCVLLHLNLKCLCSYPHLSLGASVLPTNQIHLRECQVLQYPPRIEEPIRVTSGDHHFAHHQMFPLHYVPQVLLILWRGEEVDKLL